MNDLACQKLCEIVARYGSDVCDDPRRVRALLADLCPGMPREVHVLVIALEQGVVSALLHSSGGVPWEILAGRLVRRLVEQTALAEDAARWAIDCWGIALGKGAIPSSAPMNTSRPASQPVPAQPVQALPSPAPSPPAPAPARVQQPTITIACPDCGRLVHSLAGLTQGPISCPHCGASLSVNQQPASNNQQPASNNQQPQPATKSEPGKLGEIISGLFGIVVLVLIGAWIYYSGMLDTSKKEADPVSAVDQFNRGVAYENGDGIQQDYEKAVLWYRKAADQGYASAQYNLALLFESNKGVPKELSEAERYQEAVKWYRKAAEQGKASAQNNLGVMYSQNKGIPKSLSEEERYKEAVKWYRKAAEKGDASAQYNLGLKYDNNQGVPKELSEAERYQEAVKWYRKAAEQGNASAQLNLGNMYDANKGVPRDLSEEERLKEAVKWYRKAAEQGDTSAQLNLALMYENNQGVPKELSEEQRYQEAVSWYRKAIDKGHVRSMRSLADILEKGAPGIPANKDAAARLRQQAEKQTKGKPTGE